MNVKMTIRLTNYVLILILFCLQCSGVPVLLWTTGRDTSDPFGLTSKSTVTQIDFNVLRDDYLNKSQTIIAFIQNEFSIEQFSTEDKNQFKTLMNIISDQTLEPTLLTDVLNPSEALTDFSVQEINDLNVNNGNKIAINLPKDNLLENDGLIGQLLDKIKRNVSTNVLFLVTGRHNSQSDEDVDSNDQILVNHRFRRDISDPIKKRKLTETDDQKRLIQKDNCLFFFTRSISVYNFINSSASKVLIVSFDQIKDRISTKNDTKCWQNNGEQPALLDLTYLKANGRMGLKLLIGKNKRFDYWEIKKGTATLTLSNAQPIIYDLNVEDIYAENQFSYSCSKLVISSKTGSTQIGLVFDTFQLQPFENPKNRNYIFTDSSDCQPWMTLGLWMGFITLFMLTTILLLGVYSLWKVSSPDRFENPKGKPLIISNSDE